MSGQIPLALAATSLISWVYLALFRGGFWRTGQRLEDGDDLDSWPEVVALVPARNEEDVIRDSVRSLRDQNYPGDFRVLLIDDNSSDGTVDEALRSGGQRSLEIIEAGALAPGWTGKIWALSRGEAHLVARSEKPHYLWLTDADIIHDPVVLRRLVIKAERGERALVSLMVKLNCRSFWENLLIPAFVFFFQKLYPFRWANNPARRTAAAAGGCILLERVALEDVGGFAGISSELIDDCSLARKIKMSGRAIWIGLGASSRSIRSYNLGDIWHMVARTAFWQLGNSLVLLLGTLAAMFVIYLVPPLLVLLPGSSIGSGGLLLAALAWLIMIILYIPTLIYYRRSMFLSPFLPLIALMFMGMTIDSAIRTLRGRGGEWKGRINRNVD